MHHIPHTTVFVTPVVVHWLEREIAQWVHPMKDRSDDPSHHERMLIPRSYISLLAASGPPLRSDYPCCVCGVNEQLGLGCVASVTLRVSRIHKPVCSLSTTGIFWGLFLGLFSIRRTLRLQWTSRQYLRKDTVT